MKKSLNVREKGHRFEHSYKLTFLSKQILELIGSGEIATDVAKSLKCCKSTVSYHVNRFEKHDLIQIIIKDVFKKYELTLLGSKVLTRSEKDGRVPVVLEDYPFKFSIVEGEKQSLDWVKLGSPKNWVKMGIKIGKIRVEKNAEKTIIIRTGRIKGFDVNRLFVEAGSTIQNTKSILENKFGMILSDNGVPLHKPVVRFHSPEAKILNKYGTVVVDGVASLDHSPPDNIPHVEFQGIENIKNYLEMPNRVARIERQVNSLETHLETIAGSIEKTSRSFSKLVDSLEFQTNEIRKQKQRDFKSYVK